MVAGPRITERLARGFATEFVTGHYGRPTAQQVQEIDILTTTLLAFAAMLRRLDASSSGDDDDEDLVTGPDPRD